MTMVHLRKPKILSLGEVLWDLFPEGPRFGGAPANFACHASALGAKVSMASAVGDDPRGNNATAILRDYGIDVSPIQVIAGTPTGAVSVRVDHHGKPSYTIEKNAAWDRIEWTPELESALDNTDAVYFGTLGQRSDLSRETIRRALDIAKASSTPRILDVNLRAPFFDADLIRESIELASVVKLSDEELDPVAAACGLATANDPETTLHALLDGHALDLVVLTRGADGALLVSPTEAVDQPGIPTEVCDTVGAGDSFTAALAIGQLRGDALTDIARNACQLASLVCSQPGAVPKIPGNTKPTAWDPKHSSQQT